ncbi:MAG: ATPase, T2SS/T4P/T4SS family, partial [Vicinamibacterales bacterium]
MSEFDRVVDAVNALHGAGGAEAGAPRLDAWLARARGAGASDLLLVAGVPPSLRVDGHIAAIDGAAVLDGEDIEQAVMPALPEHAARAFRSGQAVDARLRVESGRYRVNLHRERGRAAAAIRVLPDTPPRLDELNLPAGVETLSKIPRGLVLVGGATGVGKTTTLAALVDAINRRDARHIVTIEDPIEYEHRHQRSV